MRVESLAVSLRGSGFRLGELTLEIPESSVTCVLGPNGSGKTTLLRALAGLVEREGAVYLDGKESRPLKPEESREVTAYSGYELYSDPLMGFRVLDVLLTSRYPKSRSFFDSAEDMEAVVEAAKELGIEGLLARRLGELSSGEARKVLIAAAMVKKPKYYLLDEPDAHIDMGFKPELARLLKRLASAGTVLVATHDPIFAQMACEHFVVLERGRVAFAGGRGELLERAAELSRVFGVPFERAEVGGLGELLLPVYSLGSGPPSEARSQSSPRAFRSEASASSSL